MTAAFKRTRKFNPNFPDLFSSFDGSSRRYKTASAASLRWHAVKNDANPIRRPNCILNKTEIAAFRRNIISRVIFSPQIYGRPRVFIYTSTLRPARRRLYNPILFFYFASKTNKNNKLTLWRVPIYPFPCTYTLVHSHTHTRRCTHMYGLRTLQKSMK